MKHSFSLLLCLLLGLGGLRAQPAEGRNALLLSFQLQYDGLDEFREFSLGQWALAWSQLDGGGNRHLLELNRLSYKDRVDAQSRWDSLLAGPIYLSGGRYRDLALAVRYQYAWMPARQEAAWQPYLGLGAILGYEFHLFEPYNNMEYRQFTQRWAYQGELAAGFVWSWNERIFLDLGLPWQFASLELANRRRDNPSLPLRQQRQTHFLTNFHAYTRPQLRLGAGVRW
ncbi:MAG: hypothetical protein D6730_15675 [Bacteroidetes bacterium]|nr:MAG: hypothetical protein D6730_15675 [Bacteroidota bacterium]